MAKFKPYVADQLMLFPNSINNYVPQNHLSRLVNKVVEQLDTTNIEDKYSNLGQNTYHPRILIKLLFYGYAIGERSGRMIARRTETDTAYIYLAQSSCVSRLRVPITCPGHAAHFTQHTFGMSGGIEVQQSPGHSILVLGCILGEPNDRNGHVRF